MRITATLLFALLLLVGVCVSCAPAGPQDDPQDDASDGASGGASGEAVDGAAGQAAGEAQDHPTEIVQYGDHFTVICWFVGERTQDRLASETLRVVEHTWAGASALYGVAPDPLGDLVFQINVDDTRKTFLSRVNGIQAKAVEKDFGWSHHGSRAAFVRLQPPAPERVLDQLGMPPRTLRRAAREAARLARLEASGGIDAAPAWFAEGSAAWLAERAMQAEGRSAPGFESPFLGTRLHRVRVALGEQRLPSLEEFLAGAQGLLELQEVDALRELFFTFLMQSSSLEAWTALGPGLATGLATGQPIENLIAELSTLLDLDQALDLEPAFHTWLDGLRPLWREEVPSMSVHPEGWIQTPILGRNAACWAVEPAGPEAYEISGEFMLFRDRTGMGQANVLLGELDGNFIQVMFNTVTGVKVFEYDLESAEYKPITSKGLEIPYPILEWVAFRVWYEDERVFIEVHGQALRPFDVTGRDMSGAWGVGAYKGTSLIWRNLGIAPY